MPRTPALLGAGLVVALIVSNSLTASLAHPSTAPALALAGSTTVADESAAPAGTLGQTRTVTLLTGDRVVVRTTTDGKNQLQLEPGSSRRVQLLHEYVGGDDYVIPVDAQPLVATGVLDRRLFNVSQLLRDGDDDASRADLPVLVRYAGGATGLSARKNATAAGLRESRQLPAANVVAGRIAKKDTADFWTRIAVTGADGSAKASAPGIAKLWLDGMVQPLLDQSVPQIGAPEAWSAGYTGKGVKVAVLDTGIDPAHPDVRDLVVGSKDFTGESLTDTVGHGTHVASTIAGSGAASDGKYKGVAPDAQLLIGKVCVKAGCPESAIVAGMQWAADSGARVVNLSLGGYKLPGLDPMEEAVNSLTAAHGTLFVIAAGNSGPRAGTVSSPGTAEAALTVGSVSKQDKLSSFSSRGPGIDDSAVKPDLTAPGEGIMAARAAGTFPTLPAGGPNYVAISGTSMATPHVVGAAAILAQQHPDWKAGQLKAALIGSVKPLAGVTPFNGGAGRVDVGRAVKQQVFATPTTVNIGVAQWPHPADESERRTVTYHNAGAGPVTLTLSVTGYGPDGKPAPAAMFTVGEEEITVPAGGDATVPVTVATGMDTPDGNYSAVISAVSEDGKTAVHTAVGVVREVESYSHTIKVVGRDGKAPAAAWVTIYNRYYPAGQGAPLVYDLVVRNGSMTIRLPKGEYAAFTMTRAPSTAPDGPRYTLTLDLKAFLKWDQDGDIDFDARRGRLVTASVQNRTARLAMSTVGVGVTFGNFTSNWEVLDVPAADVTNVDGTYVVPSSGPQAQGAKFYGSAYFGRPSAGGNAMSASPYAYNLAWLQRDRIPAGLTYRPKDKQLATVKVSHGSQVPGTWGARMADPGLGMFMPIMMMPLPFTRTEYYSAPQGMSWNKRFEQHSSPDWDTNIAQAQETALPKVYQPGARYTEQWNRAVFAPGFPANADNTYYGFRRTDVMFVGIPLYSDGDPTHLGDARATGNLTMYADGKKVGTTPGPGGGSFLVPAAPARYRLEATTDRSPSDVHLTTKMNMTWTFGSAQPASGVRQVLPLMAMRLSPAVDQNNKAPSGCLFRIPLTVQFEPHTTGKVKKVTVEYSTNGGKTWKAAGVAREGAERFAAFLAHPKAPNAYVSLRTEVQDTAGNTASQTLINAYQLR